MSTDTLTQPQRESLINILVLGMYSDGLLSLSEDESLNGFLDALKWESGTGRTVFLTDSITRANHISSEADLADYIQSNANTFDTAESKKAALDALTEFLKTDGLSEAEAPFLSKISQALQS